MAAFLLLVSHPTGGAAWAQDPAPVEKAPAADAKAAVETPALSPEGCLPPAEGVDVAALSDAVALLDGGGAASLAQLRALAEANPASGVVLYHLSRAEALYHNGAAALGPARKAQSLDPLCAPYTRHLARLATKQGDAGATAAWARLVELAPDDLEARQTLSLDYVAQGQLLAAEPHRRWMRDHFPDDAETVAAYAELMGWLGQPEEANSAFTRVQQLDPKVLNAVRWRTWGDALRALGQPTAALGAYRASLDALPAKSPERRPTQEGIGWTLVDLKQWDEALATFENVKKGAPRDPQTWANLARVHHAAGHHPQAVTHYEKAVSLAPEYDALRLEAAQVIASDESGRARATELLLPLVNRPEAKLEHILALAEIYSWQSDTRPEALELVDRVLERDAENTKAWAIARQSVLWMPPSPTLVPWLDRLVVRFPADSDLEVQRAIALASTPDRADDAIAALDRVIAANPSRVDARIGRAESRLRRGEQSQDLVQELAAIAAMVPSDVGMQARVGAGLMSIDAWGPALECFDRCVAGDPQHLGCLKGRAAAYESLHRDAEALGALEAAARVSTSEAELRALRGSMERIRLQEQVKAAQDLLADGKKEEAEAAYAALVRANPDDVDSWVVLGALRAERKAWKSALEDFQQALALEPTHVGALQGASGVLIALGRYEEAEGLIRREIEIAPSPDAMRRLDVARTSRQIAAARESLKAGATDPALEALGSLYQSNGQDAEVAMLYGEALFAAKRYESAAEAWGRAVRMRPQDPRALRGAALALWEVDRRADAWQMMTEARALVTPSEQAVIDRQLLAWTVSRAEEAKLAGRYDRALELYREAYTLAPTEGYVLRGLAGLYWTAGQEDLASKYYVQALRQNPQDIEAARGAAQTLLIEGQPDVVVSLLEGSPTAKDAQVAESLKKARVLLDLRRLEAAWARGDEVEALDLANRASAAYPRDGAPWHLLARLAMADGRYVDALNWYRRALESDPSSQADLYGMIATLQAMGRHAEAARLIGQARSQGTAETSKELDRLEAAGWMARAEQDRARGEMESALAAYLRAAELAPDASWVVAGLAGLYAADRQYDEALELYERALALNPEDRAALAGKVSILTADGRPDQAEAPLTRLESLEGDTPRVQRLKADLRREEGAWAEAITLDEDLLRADPTNAAATRGLMTSWLEAGQPEMVLDLAARDLPDFFDDQAFLRLSGGALRALGRSDLAVPVFRRVALRWPSPQAQADLEAAWIGAYIEAAEAARARGKVKEAELLYEEAMQAAPDHPELLLAVGGQEASAGDLDAAEARFAQALELNEDDPWAIIGHANARAGLGQTNAALRELEEGWERTQEPWVGLNRARLLIDNGRYAEADRQLREVEEVLAAQRAERQKAADAARSNGWRVDADRAVDRFWGMFSRLAAETGPELSSPVPEPLPPLATATLRRLETSAEEAAAAKEKTLADLDPSVPPPVRQVAAGPSGAPKSRLRSTGAVDLAEVELLLEELREGEEVEAQRRATEERQAPRPVLTFEEESTGAAGEAARPGGLAADLSSTEPFQPRISRKDEPTPRQPKSDLRDPHQLLERLREDLRQETSSHFRLGLGLDARTGTPGTTALVAVMGDARLMLRPAPAFGLWVYGTPVLATDIIRSQNGVMAGGGILLAPGALSLEAELGTSPMGFTGPTQPLGRVNLGLDAIPHLGIDAEVAREAVADSLLSWAGLIDAGSEEVFGRVARSRASLGIRAGLDPRVLLTLGGDVARYDGLQMDDNTWIQGRFGLRFVTWADAVQRVSTGVEALAFSFAEQQDAFEPGGGGYFSPELFVLTRGRVGYEALLLEDRLDLDLAGSLGLQYTVGEATDYLAPGLRPALAIDARASYTLDRGLSLGARYNFDNAGAVYTRNTVWIYLQKNFGGGAND